MLCKNHSGCCRGNSLGGMRLLLFTVQNVSNSVPGSHVLGLFPGNWSLCHILHQPASSKKKKKMLGWQFKQRQSDLGNWRYKVLRGLKD